MLSLLTTPLPFLPSPHTYAIFCPIEILCELVTITHSGLASPHIDDCSNAQVTLMVVVSVHSSSLSIDPMRIPLNTRHVYGTKHETCVWH